MLQRGRARVRTEISVNINGCLSFCSFNGAARVCARRFSRQEQRRTGHQLLQRGRARVRTEILEAVAQVPHSLQASTGPRACAHGDSDTRDRTLRLNVSLQRGRARVRTEIPSNLVRLASILLGFNGAARVCARRSSCVNCPGFHNRASTGPRACAHGDGPGATV